MSRPHCPGREWLRDLPSGIDRVTEAHFPDQNVAGWMFGLGTLGSKTEAVGKGKKAAPEAPIFELRRMAGYIDHRLWTTLALELFDYFLALNRLKSPTFKGRQDGGEGRRAVITSAACGCRRRPGSSRR